MKKSCKGEVLAALEACKGEFVSGAALAEQLGLSRNAVWNAVKSLTAEGYAIESVTRRGYRLAASCSILSAASVSKYLDSDVRVEFHDSIDSTNNRCKLAGDAGEPGGLLVVADSQTAGRGRQGRPFFSPPGTGVYFSLLLRPEFTLDEVSLFTSYTAVCAARAISEVFGVQAQIKWVNDLFIGARKVGGILTEASFDAETRTVSHVVVGIGVNVLEPAGGWPAELAHVCQGIGGAGADSADLRARVVAGTINRFMAGYAQIPEKQFLEEYRQRSILSGRTVEIDLAGTRKPVTVVGIDDEVSLIVEDAAGTRHALRSGEVHLSSKAISQAA